jgi:hypothetical protein
VIYPKTLLFPEPETSIGRKFQSLDGKVTLNVTSVDNTEQQTAAAAYAEMVHTYQKLTPVTVVDHRLEPNGFLISTKNGSRLAHMKMVVSSRYYRMLSMEYDESDARHLTLSGLVSRQPSASESMDISVAPLGSTIYRVVVRQERVTTHEVTVTPWDWHATRVTTELLLEAPFDSCSNQHRYYQS